ncbi:polycystic kidney disease protein 1-like 2 isoform X2 [Denticeps clupeoides]|uniref:polycystic kidney disease protein 1-like 2 isoform X2 n=1 Tax=Denticeps clupeoides TaxID=299321 RepID=UPI0010A3E5E7|nr:polycystic kidney disease protein 1-like 2 isoform X2 [Denticeps clupeoides]
MGKCSLLLHLGMVLGVFQIFAQHKAKAQSCTDYQEVFDGSCFEFVALERSFLHAEAWCERAGGHLAFIQNEETQQFLEKHLHQEQNWWIGLAPASINFTLDSEDHGGPLSWLDGSDISYSNWIKTPWLGAGCGSILGNSGFQWEATENCSQELHFICQFESGRSLACVNYNATLQCGSGQVIEIVDSFYGRKNIHYCQSSSSYAASSAQEECSWVEVGDLVAGHCHGLQVCQTAADVASFGEPCPRLGSYLFVEYRCNDGLLLLMNEIAAVSDNVTITVNWLLHPFQGNLTCSLNTGDGLLIDPYHPDGLKGSVAHMYKDPGVFTVEVECTTSDWHVTAQKVITIQEPLVNFSDIKCYSSNQSTNAPNCKALQDSPLTIQIEMEAGTNITYTILSGSTVLGKRSAINGTLPHNITLSAVAMQAMRPGCHMLSLLASNNVTAAELSSVVDVCFVEPISSLKALVSQCPDSDLQITVSLEHGAPVQLLFHASDGNQSFSESGNMNSDLQTFNISRKLQGALNVKVRAWNLFSSVDVDVDVENSTTFCDFESVTVPADQGNSTMGNVSSSSKKLAITASTEIPLIGISNVTLGVLGPKEEADHLLFHWQCIGGDCPCDNSTVEQSYVITKDCLPKPFNVAVYAVNVTRTGNTQQYNTQTANRCIRITPGKDINVKITCTNCNPLESENDLDLRLQCEHCQEIFWLLEDIMPISNILGSCYTSNHIKPYKQIATQVSSVKVPREVLRRANHSISIVAYGIADISGIKSGYDEFTITTSMASSPQTERIEPFIVTTEKSIVLTHSAVTVKPVDFPTSLHRADSGGHSDSATCSISPASGDILTPFYTTCSVNPYFCLPTTCTYHLQTVRGNSLNLGNIQLGKPIFLPPGDKKRNFSLDLVVTVKNSAGQIIKTSFATQVKDTSKKSTVEELGALVSKHVIELQRQGQYTAADLAQIFKSVCNTLNEKSTDIHKKDAKKKLREQMLSTMSAAIQSAPIWSCDEFRAVAESVTEITLQNNELTPIAQVEASSILNDLSNSLLTFAEGESNELMLEAATPLIEAAGNILVVSVNTKEQSAITSYLLSAMHNVQGALLARNEFSQEPTVLSTEQISLYVNRMSSDDLKKQSFKIQNSVFPSFTFPALGPSIVSSLDHVQVRMMSFQVNPFSWNEAQPINSTVGALSLTREDGSTIPVANLTSEIEIFLPRPEASELKTTFLDLGNFSTLMINVTMPGIHLVVKLEPSEDVALHLLLGFQEYPNSTYFEAQTQLPHEGKTQEERYTWVLSPRDVIVEEGVYYLLVRPIVEAGVKSTNATVYITSIAAQCMYWDEAKSNWSDYGCRVGPLTTPFVTQCLCNHLTFFGSSFFVMPNVVDVSQTAQLFSTFVNNPVVVCFVIAIFVAYFLMVVWARKKDTEDGAKLKITVLDDNDPLAEYRYLLNISTGHRRGASTSSQVTVTLMGSEGESDPHHLTDPDKPVFDRGAVDMFLLTTPFSLGDLHSIRLWHDNSGEHPAWYVNKVMVQDLETGMKWSFLCNSWLAIDMGECVLDKVFPVATEMDLKRFSNLFYMKTAKDFQDGHIWFSVLNRPPSSNFTRVQRISCCFSLFLCTMLTSIMFWGVPTDPAEQTMDLGQIEFTWQQVMIGFQSSIIMFPINLLIVTIFRHTRSRQQKQINAAKQSSKTELSKQSKTGHVSPSQPSSPQSDHREVTPDAVTKDIKKIAQSLAKVLKSPMPIIDLQGKPTNINTLLSLVEDIIQQNYVGNQFCPFSKMAICVTGSQEKITSSDQKLSVYHQYLYRQLQHVEKELDILGPAQFSTADSYTQAVQQVRGMKGLLEPHMSCSSVEDLGSPSAARTTKGGNGDRKCCQKGLPWWFVFVAWILVAATSGVSAFFTMLYGLKYGKERSISWLISMVVSFFESLFITQPLKVLGFAVFFSLVLKKIDQEEYEDVPIEGAVTKPGDPSLGITRRNSTCSFYQPPPPSDIERMRNNMMKEKKVFALLREILIYAGFMWMLLLVAYGQRDPNAFHLRQHIQQCFSKGIKDSMSLSEIFSWTNTTFLTNLFGQKPGFITDGNSRLVGNARLRQIRVNKDSCHVTHSMHPSIPECHAPYSWEAEDMGSYGTRWNSTSNRNTSQTISPWQYQTQHKVRASPIWGSITLYRGGGFVVDMGPERQNATRMLQYIFNNDWLDVYTRAIFLELTVYNANVNLFCIITLMFESSAVGAFQYNTQLHSVRLYQSTGGFHIFVMFSEVTFLLFVCYYMFMQGKLMKQLKWAYFKSKWNLLELAMIILSWSAMSVFIKRTLLGNRDLEYYENNKDQFASFHDTANADAVLGYLIAFLVLLATIKLWHLLRLNPKLHLITSTLQRAWTDISGFLVVMAIMFLAYSIACNLIYGWKLYSYKTLLNAAQTIISLQLGIFNYEEVLDNNPVLGSFLIGTCIIFMTFVPSEEEEIVDLMLMKVCSLFGIKIKKKGGDNHSTNKDNRLPADSTPFVMS